MDTAEIQLPRPAASQDPTLVASRALLGVVARSLAEALEMVTLPQFRVMVILSSTGPLRMGALAARAHTVPSTFSRSIDRMVAGGWVRRRESPDSRREILIELTTSGQHLVDHVTERRRAEIAAILARLSPAAQAQVGSAFALFAEAAGEPLAEDLLSLGI
ncbi:MAG: MarR family transcriptional regulator [Salinibacterium sp.]|nr:MarR family transcriptional regulator [Salinibacterium sp.]